ncbi:MAG: YceI family protein [Cyclobacteriaceae bacterium]|nr:YceI family protein [Cyclobacteriaceae bacterium]
MKKINALFALILMAGAVSAQTTWNIDKVHSSIGFSVTHMVVSEASGNFKDFSAKVVSKTADFDGAEVNFTAKAASINTENERRDGHLKSADFLDAEKFPEITFKGNLVKAGGKYQLKGQFTMKGVTKDVAFDVTYGGTIDTGRGVKAGFKLTGKINRQDYGVKFASKLQDGSAVLGDDVEITCKIELDKEQAPAAEKK